MRFATSIWYSPIRESGSGTRVLRLARGNGQTVNGRLPSSFCRFTVRTPLNGGTANDFGNVFLTSTVSINNQRF